MIALTTTHAQSLGYNSSMANNRLRSSSILMLVFVFTNLAASVKGTPVQTPISLNTVNPHYFTFRGKPTVLITSGEHYGAVLNADFDFKAYLDELHRSDLNLTRVWSGSYREVPGSFGITDNTLAPQPSKYVCPWARSAKPGAIDGGNLFDLTRWDPAYFRRLHLFMAEASKRGVVVEMNLFCPFYEDAMWKASPMYIGNNLNSIGNLVSNEAYTLKHPELLKVQDEMVRKIVAELAQFDNLYFEVCNEPYFGGVTMEWQRHIVQTIVDAEKGGPHRHLISMNIANEKAEIRDPDPAVSIFNFHYATPPVTVGMNYALNKVIGENETGFRGKEDVLYRSEAWEFMLAGGGLYNNLDYSFTAAHPNGAFLDFKSPGGGSPSLRYQLQLLKRFIESFDFIHMAPNKGIIVGSKDLRVEVLAEPGKQVAAYLFGTKQTELHLDLPAGNYRVFWLHPVSGAESHLELHHPGGALALRVPEHQQDIALGIRRKR